MIYRLLLLSLVPLFLLGNAYRGGAGSDNGGYGEISKTGTDAFVIDGTSQWHGVIGGSSDELAGDLTIHTGERVDLTGATFATAGGGAQTQITGVAHGQEQGDIITITGCSDAAQNGVAEIVAVGGASDFTIDIAFSSDPATEGFLIRADHFEIERAGVYLAHFAASAAIQTSAATSMWALYDDKTNKHQISRRYSNALDAGAHVVMGLINASAGDEIWVAVQNSTNGNDFNINDYSFTLIRVW